MGVDVSALGGVRERSGGREDGGEDVNRRVHRRRTSGLAFIDDLWAVFNSRCDNVRPLVLLVFIGEMPKKIETRGPVSLRPDKKECRDCGEIDKDQERGYEPRVVFGWEV